MRPTVKVLTSVTAVLILVVLALFTSRCTAVPGGASNRYDLVRLSETSAYRLDRQTGAVAFVSVTTIGDKYVGGVYEFRQGIGELDMTGGSK